MRSLLVLSALFASSLSHASSAVLDQIRLDSNLKLNGRVEGAVINVDLPNGVTTLTLSVNTCPVGAMCIVGAMPRNIELPVVSSGVDSCGTLEVVAKRDDRPVDEWMQRLIVRDNTRNTCKTFVALEPTEVVYETESSGFGGTHVKTVSNFSGAALQP